MTTATTVKNAPDVPEVGPRSGLWTRYRSAYSKLPPGAQMIGLQVWLPALFVLLFCFCYIFAFHSPTPKDVPVAVVGSGQTTSAFANALEKNAAGALQVKTISTPADARDQVRSGEIAAAYVPGVGSAQLVIASGAQYQLATLAKSVFTPVAAAEKVSLTIDDLAPLPKGDSYGTSLFYMTLLATIGGYMVAMFVGLMGGALRHRTRVGIIVGFSVLFPFVSTLLVRFPLGVISGHFFAVWAIGAATAFAIGIVVNGLSYFMGRFVTGAALFLFVFLNVPSSGGAFPAELVPEPFKWLHPFVSGAGTLDLYRHVIYGVGPGVRAGLLVLACYAAGGVILTLVGRPYARRLAARRAARGARPSMMAAAQQAAVALAMSQAAASSAPSRAEATGAEETSSAVAEVSGPATASEPAVLTTPTGANTTSRAHHGQHAAQPYTVTVTAAEPVTVTVTVTEPAVASAAAAALAAANAPSRGHHKAERNNAAASRPQAGHELDEAEREMAAYRAAEVESDAVAAVTGGEV